MSARQAADKEKRKLLRAREQLEKDKGALMDKREERRHWEERWRLLEYDEDVLSKAFVPLGQSREESKVSGAATGTFNRSGPRDLQGAPLRSSPIPVSPPKRSKAALACQNRTSVAHEVIEEAKGKAELRRKVEEFVEMVKSEDKTVKVKPAAVTPPKEATSDTKVARKGPLVKPKDFDGTTPVEAFLQQIKTCAKNIMLVGRRVQHTHSLRAHW